MARASRFRSSFTRATPAIRRPSWTRWSNSRCALAPRSEPLSIQLYAGNPRDPPTFLDAVEQLKVRFGTEERAAFDPALRGQHQRSADLPGRGGATQGALWHRGDCGGGRSGDDQGAGPGGTGGGQFSLRDRVDRPASADTLESRRIATGLV